MRSMNPTTDVADLVVPLRLRFSLLLDSHPGHEQPLRDCGNRPLLLGSEPLQLLRHRRIQPQLEPNLRYTSIRTI